GHLFSNIVRKSPSEKRILILLIGGGVHPFRLIDLKDHLKNQAASTSWISVSDIVYPRQFSPSRDISTREAEFQKINEIAHLTESELEIFSQLGEEKYNWLRKYFSGLSKYRD